jgi:hypothetical protein
MNGPSLFNDDTPDYFRTSDDDGDAEYGEAQALPNEKLYRPGSPEAVLKAQMTAGAMPGTPQGNAIAQQQAAAAAADQKRRDELARQQAQQQHAANMAQAKAAADAAKATQGKGSTLPPKVQLQPPAGTVPFLPSTPQDVAIGLATSPLPYDPGAGTALEPAAGRPMWQYAVGGTVAVGTLALIGWYVVRPMVRGRR